MRIIYTISIIFLLHFQISYACDCKSFETIKEKQDYEYENSNIIFIGEVLEINKVNHTFKVKIIELFKGTEKAQIINGKFDIQCGPYINSGGKWLIYGNIIDKTLEVTPCGLTRSFINPKENPITPPPPPNTNLNKSLLKQKHLEWLNREKVELKKEIYSLRKKYQN
jgi:hypothetical protein